MDKLKVLYIAGNGRSGSTIIGNILGQIEGFVHVGELYFIWSHGLIHNYLCGCGVPVQECPTWKAVFDEAYGGIEKTEPREMIRRFRQHFGSRNYPPPLTKFNLGPQKPDEEKIICDLEALYQAIQSVNSAKVIIDGSKNHLQLSALSKMKNVELYMLHLIRDPRGVAYSNQKKKQRIGNKNRENMSRLSAWKSSLKWISRNVYVRLVARKPTTHYLMLRYEDFINSPLIATRQILKWINEESDLLFMNEQNKVNMLVHHHTIFGNPNRFHTGQEVTLRLDNAWETKLKTRDKLLTQLLTLPLLRKYGYKL